MCLIKVASKKAEAIAEHMLSQFSKMPEALRKSITFYNGTEFAEYHKLNHKLKMKTYFCDPHSPWQKGGIENGNGRIRRDLPRKTNLESITKIRLDAIAAKHNNTPRKCLGYRIPAELFNQQLLHFICEFTLAKEAI